MNARIIIVSMLAIAIGAGVALNYLQVYAYYEEVEVADVQLTGLISGEPEEVLHENFKGIDSDSSPIRYRACFDLGLSIPTLTETFELYDDAVPLTAPGWFDCFDAAAVGAALEADEALAFLGVKNIRYGIDRVVAVYPDGRAFAWHQINSCGEAVFDGEAAPEGCPPAPEEQN